MKEFKVRTDLAVELKEDIEDTGKSLEINNGIEVIKEVSPSGKAMVTKVNILNEKGSRLIGKDIGIYITLESDELAELDEDYHREIAMDISKYILELINVNKKDIDIKKKNKVLIVGLGNRNATPDSLGPRVIDNVFIPIVEDENNTFYVKAISPGVLAQTGMEAAKIIKGIVVENQIDLLIVVDSLAARNISRLNTTIQLSNAGITPGSGVGNHRSGINQKTMEIPVIAIGVPTVVDAPTIVSDTFDNILDSLSKLGLFKEQKMIFNDFTAEERYQLIKEIIKPEISEMYVTTKDIDETMKYLGYTISEGLNIIFSGSI